MIDLVGQQLGNYRLVRLLGRGGFAEVYLGEHVYLGTQAAIKVLYTQLATSDLEQFRVEAQTIARLEHPHIVRILEFGVEDTTPFLVMGYAPGGTLRDRHSNSEQLPLSTIVSYVTQVADALQYAHQEKIIHRDIKPENMLLGRRQEVLLSDFGIALVSQTSRYQSTKDMAGTIAYMAPEQIEAHPHPASDQYSLGVVVYEWISGERPFHGSFTEIAIKHTLAVPPSLREKVPTIPSAVEQVVMIALAKAPKQRFASVQDFANALKDASESTQPARRPSAQLSPPGTPIPPSSSFSQANAETDGPALTDSYHLTQSPQARIETQTFHDSQQTLPEPPRRRRLSVPIAAILILVVLILLGGSGLIYATIIQPNQIHAQATATAQAQIQLTATNPYPPYKGTLVLDDSLRDNSRGYNWEEETRDQGSCTFMGDSYHTAIALAGYFHSCLATATDFNDFIFEVQMSIVSGNSGGIVFRADRLTTHLYYFLIDQNGSYSLRVYYDKNAHFTTILSGNSAPLTGHDLIGVVAQGGQINLYVNRKLVGQINDTTYTHGQLGILVFSGEAAFRNARVWKL